MPTFPQPASQFVPHRPPMLLVDEVLQRGPDHIQARSLVRDVLPFGSGHGSLPSYIGLEMMAQTAAAFSGSQRAARGLAPCIGLLLGTRHFRASVAEFVEGTALHIEVREKLTEYGDMHVFDCRITAEDGRLLAEAELKAYQPDDIEAWLDEQP